MRGKNCGQMKTTLVTGGIGSGKSEVCRFLTTKGLPVYNCDSRCKALYDEVPGLKACIEEELKLPFEKWNVIFADEELRNRLESMVFPALLEDIHSWRDNLDTPRCFIESATALDKPAFLGLWDDVWLVTADYDVRLKRNPKVAERSSVQHYDSSLADEVIANNGTLEELYKKIEKIL